MDPSGLVFLLQLQYICGTETEMSPGCSSVQAPLAMTAAGREDPAEWKPRLGAAALGQMGLGLWPDGLEVGEGVDRSGPEVLG